jgi:hypothetical protein
MDIILLCMSHLLIPINGSIRHIVKLEINLKSEFIFHLMLNLFIFIEILN